MARANRRGGFGALRGATNNRSVISNEFPNNPQHLDRCIIKTTNQEYYWNKPTTEWIPLFGAGGGGNLGGLVYHNDTNTTAVSTNVEVGTVDVTMAFDGSLVVTGTFVGTASTAMTITSLIKLDTVTQHTAVQYISGAVDDTVSFSVVLEGIEAGDYTVSVDMSASTGTFTLDASEQHLYALTYYDAVIGGSGGVPTIGYILGGIDATSARLQDTDEYNPDTWTNKTDMPTPARFGLGSSAITDSIYVYGGSASTGFIQDTDKYLSDTWSSMTNIPTPARYEMGSSTIGNSGYIYGGDPGNGLFDTDEYTPDTWSNKTDMPSPKRYRLAASTISNSGYIYGGLLGLLQDTDEYTPDTWTSKTNMPSPGRYYLTASTINTAGYIFGGDSGSKLQDTDEYIPDTWTSKTNMPSPGRRELTSSSILNTTAYVYCGNGATILQDTDEYLPDTWTSKTDAPTPARRNLASSSL